MVSLRRSRFTGLPVPLAACIRCRFPRLAMLGLNGFERDDALSAVGFQPLAQRVPIVGDQFCAVAGAADHHHTGSSACSNGDGWPPSLRSRYRRYGPETHVRWRPRRGRCGAVADRPRAAPSNRCGKPAAVRLGSTQEKSRRVIADSNGDRSGDTRPLWITVLSPPDSWRSLRQPGYLQLDQVRTPKHCVWGYDRTLKVRNFRSTKVGNFQSQLTELPVHRDRGPGLRCAVGPARPGRGRTVRGGERLHVDQCAADAEADRIAEHAHDPSLVPGPAAGRSGIGRSAGQDLQSLEVPDQGVDDRSGRGISRFRRLGAPHRVVRQVKAPQGAMRALRAVPGPARGALCRECRRSRPLPVGRARQGHGGRKQAGRRHGGRKSGAPSRNGRCRAMGGAVAPAPGRQGRDGGASWRSLQGDCWKSATTCATAG